MSPGWDRRTLHRRYGLEAHGAILGQGDAEVDAYRLTHKLLAEAAARGARVYDRTKVTARRPTNGGVTLETDRGTRIVARRVVMAAGYELHQPCQPCQPCQPRP